MRMRLVVLVCVLLALAMCAAAQETGMVASPAKLKYGPVPNIPECAKAAPLHGNPMEGAFVLSVKATAGCTVPLHWHTANEQLGFVTGSGSVAMKGEKAQPMAAGAYVFLPGKSQHSFVCKTACNFFLASDGKFDIHYVDDAGQEITPEQAFKMHAKPMSKGASKTMAKPK